MDLCLICLRTDKFLKHASVELEDFHDEISEFSIVALCSSIYYCNECSYLLAKFWKFKEKCVKAANLYKEWLVTHASKKRPVNLLYTQLPPSSLGPWIQSARTCVFTVQQIDSQTDGGSELELAKDVLVKEVKLECDQRRNIENSNEFDDDDDDDENVDDIPEDTDNKNSNDVSEREKNNTNNSKNIKEKEIRDKLECDQRCNIRNINRIDTDIYNKSKNTPKAETCNKTRNKEKENCENKKIETKKGYRKTESGDREKEGRELLEELDRILQDDSDDDDIVDLIMEEKSREIVANMLKPMEREEKTSCEMPKKKSQREKIEGNDRQYVSMFEIEYLKTPEQKVAEFERRKSYECYLTAENKCELCFQVFKFPKQLDYHINRWHVERPGTECCPICKTWHSQTRAHKLTHGQVFKCKLCPLVTYHRSSMVNHFEWHRGKQYDCKECNLTYKSLSMYRTHMGKVHRQGRNVCTACGRGFYSPSGLLTHKNISYQCKAKDDDDTTEGVRCDDCDVTLPSLKVYEAHVADVHKRPTVGRGRTLPTDRAGLPICRPNWTKTNTTATVRQIKTRMKPAKYTCRVCEMEGGSFGWLELHLKKEHPNEDVGALYADKKSYLCDVCGVGFANKYSLRDHIHTHTGALPYSCDICPKKFHSSARRIHHRLCHFPSTLACKYCGKLFKTAANLYSHTKIHIGEKNHVCDICGKAFILASNLRGHVRGVHFNMRRAKRRGKMNGDGVEET